MCSSDLTEVCGEREWLIQGDYQGPGCCGHQAEERRWSKWRVAGRDEYACRIGESGQGIASEQVAERRSRAFMRTAIGRLDAEQDRTADRLEHCDARCLDDLAIGKLRSTVALGKRTGDACLELATREAGARAAREKDPDDFGCSTHVIGRISTIAL